MGAKVLMTSKSLLAGVALAIIGLAATAAQAATPLYEAPTAEMPTDTSITDTFYAPKAGSDLVSFTIDGYSSLDGQNPYEDDFSLKLNNVTVLTGTFNLGGGGNNVVLYNPYGGTADNVSGNGTAVTWAGGHVVVEDTLPLVAELNHLTFTYTSLAGKGHAGFQGLGDEGWGIERLTVNGATAVPEPGTWALMLMGFGGLGATLRGSRRGRGVKLAV